MFMNLCVTVSAMLIYLYMIHKYVYEHVHVHDHVYELVCELNCDILLVVHEHDHG
jgi:hypothetical protein